MFSTSSYTILGTRYATNSWYRYLPAGPYLTIFIPAAYVKCRTSCFALVCIDVRVQGWR